MADRPMTEPTKDEVSAARQLLSDRRLDAEFMDGVRAGWNAAQADDPEAAIGRIHAGHQRELREASDDIRRARAIVRKGPTMTTKDEAGERRQAMINKLHRPDLVAFLRNRAEDARGDRAKAEDFAKGEYSYLAENFDRAADELERLSSSPQPEAVWADAAELPWCDLKAAFDYDGDAEDIFAAEKVGDLELPHGWSLDETDGSGARLMVVFRCEVMPTVHAAAAIKAALAKLKETGNG